LAAAAIFIHMRQRVLGFERAGLIPSSRAAQLERLKPPLYA